MWMNVDQNVDEMTVLKNGILSDGMVLLLITLLIILLIISLAALHVVDSYL